MQELPKNSQLRACRMISLYGVPFISCTAILASCSPRTRQHPRCDFRNQNEVFFNQYICKYVYCHGFCVNSSYNQIIKYIKWTKIIEFQSIPARNYWSVISSKEKTNHQNTYCMFLLCQNHGTGESYASQILVPAILSAILSHHGRTLRPAIVLLGYDCLDIVCCFPAIDLLVKTTWQRLQTPKSNKRNVTRCHEACTCLTPLHAKTPVPKRWLNDN